MTFRLSERETTDIMDSVSGIRNNPYVCSTHQNKFEMEVRVSSTGAAPSNYYGKSGVDFNFNDSEGAFLGRVSFLAATTQYPFDNVATDPNRAAIQVVENVNRYYLLSVEEILSHINIDETEIAIVEMTFKTYSSTRPNPYVEAELWIDNVSVSYRKK